MAVDTDDRFKDALRREGSERRGIRTEGRKFDAGEAIEETARAGYEEVQEERDKALEEMRGRQVGAGRLRTGFGFEDQDRLAEEFEEDFSRQLAARALDAEQMNLRNLEGRRRSNRYLDLLTSERQREQKEEAAIWEGLGTVAGTAIGAFA